MLDPVCCLAIDPKDGIEELFVGVPVVPIFERRVFFRFSVLSVRTGERFGDEVRIEALDIEDPDDVRVVGNECSLFDSSLKL